MALTYSLRYTQRWRGGRKLSRTTVTLDNNYPVGGYSLLYGPAPSGLNLDVVLDNFHVVPSSTNPFEPRVDIANKKVLWGVIGSGGTWVEVSNGATGLNGLTCEVWAEGT